MRCVLQLKESSLLMFKGKGVVPTNAANTRDILRDINLKTKWNPMMKVGKVIEQLDESGAKRLMICVVLSV